MRTLRGCLGASETNVVAGGHFNTSDWAALNTILEAARDLNFCAPRSSPQASVIRWGFESANDGLK